MSRSFALVVLALAVLAACGGTEAGLPRDGGVVVPADGALHGVVLLVDGTPAVGATVTLGGAGSVAVGTDGTYAFDGLTSGEQTLSAALAPYRTEVRRVPVQAHADTLVPPLVLMRITAIGADRLAGEAGRSADGRSLVFGAGHDPRAHRLDAWFWNDSGATRRLAEGLDDCLVDESHGAPVSPDGRFVALPLIHSDAGPYELQLIEAATGNGRSLGLDVGWLDFAPDGSRLTLHGRDLRTIALPSLEETVLCRDSTGIEATAEDPATMICRDGRWDLFVDDTPDLIRWDLVSLVSTPVAGNARIVCIDGSLDRALLLIGDGPGPYAAALWRFGEAPVTVADGVPKDGASCDPEAEKGFLLAGGSLVRVDLLGGSARVLDSDVVDVRPAPSMEQVFYFKGRELPERRLFTWDERSGVTTELATGVSDDDADGRFLADDWPRQAVFVAAAPGAYPATGDLYLYRFGAADPPRQLATGAAIVRLDQGGFAYFHDVDAGQGSLSVLAAGEDTPTPVLEGIESTYPGDERWPRLSAGFDRVLAYRPDTGSGPQAAAWGREHGVVSPGGEIESVDPTFARVVTLDVVDEEAWRGVLRLLDFETGQVRTLSDRAKFMPFPRHDLARILFVETDDGGEQSFRLYDHATGTTQILLSPAVDPTFVPDEDSTRALLGSGPLLHQELFMADLATGRVEPVGATAESAYDECPLDHGRSLVQGSGGLLLVDLPAMSVTVLDRASDFWLAPGRSAIVYRRDVARSASTGEVVGELWARALRPDAISYRVDGEVRGVVLDTAGSFLYEVEGGGIRAGEWPR